MIYLGRPPVHDRTLPARILDWWPPQHSRSGIDEGKVCLDCALLCGVVQNKVGMNLVEQYTNHVTELIEPTPRAITTLLASKSLKF